MATERIVELVKHGFTEAELFLHFGVVLTPEQKEELRELFNKNEN